MILYYTIIVGKKKLVFNITASTSSTEKKNNYTATAEFTLAYITVTAALATTAADPGK